jgi:hypothetical protein
MISGQNTNMQTGNTHSVAMATSSKATQIHYKVPILKDADGYAHWHFCMTMVLEENDLMTIVKGSLIKPDPTVDATGHADWMLKDRRACIQISTTLHKGALNVMLLRAFMARLEQGVWHI